MNNKGLTITMIFEAESANYGEGIGNITALKKMSRGDGNMYTYISRQALRYSIIEMMGCNNTPVSGEAGTVQFAPSATISDYPEIDLFGYMKTRSKKDSDAGGADTRSAVVRLSNAISLEPYLSDMDFLTNMGLARRQNLPNGIAQSEIHRSLYSYTVSIDLDRVGEDETAGISIPAQEKANRICKLLDTIQYLYRDIKGRRENLAPVFVIGGIYNRKSPYFEGRATVDKGKLNIERLKTVIESCEDTKSNTLVGLLDDSFSNSASIRLELNADSIGSVFEKLKNGVREYYA